MKKRFTKEQIIGFRIEVKSAAYLQSWNQKALSPISFSVAPALGWDAKAGARSKEKIRPADVCVFCLQSLPTTKADARRLTQPAFAQLRTNDTNYLEAL